MKPEDKKYILENSQSKSIEELSKELGLKERKIKRFLENRKIEKREADSAEQETFPKKGYSKKSNLLIGFAIFVVALLVRLIYLNQITTSPFFIPFYNGLDDYLYDSWAQTIAQGDILGKEVFYGLPLYPYFLGFVYFLFGHNVYVAKLIQFAIGSLSCALVFFAGQKVFNRTVGILAAGILSFYAMGIYFEGQFVSSSLAIFLNLIVILLLLSIKENPRLFKWILAGVFIGLSSLANASILIFIPFAVFWGAKTAQRALKNNIATSVVLFFLGIVLVITPVTIRNYVVAKDFVPVTAHSGITFYAGNNATSDGTFHMPREVGTSVVDSRENSKIIAEKVSNKKLKPSEVSSFWFSQGIGFIKNEPTKYINLILRKMFLFWNAYEIPDIMPLAFFKQYSPFLRLPLFGFGLICPLALVGIYLSFRKKKYDSLLLISFIGSVFISTTIYFVNSRYRLIAVPYMSIFAALAIRWFYDQIRTKKLNKIIGPVIIFIFLSILVHIKVLEFGMAQSHNNLGIILKRQGLYKEAISEYEKAIQENPKYDSPYFNLGLLYLERGNNAEAIEAFNNALRANPNFIKAHQKLGELYSSGDQKDKAEYHKAQYLKLLGKK